MSHTKDPLLDHQFTDPHLSYSGYTALEMHPLPCMSPLSQKIHGKINSHKLVLAVMAVHRTTNTESHSSPLQSPTVLSSLKDFVETQFCTPRITLNCLLDFSIFSQEDYSTSSSEGQHLWFNKSDWFGPTPFTSSRQEGQHCHPWPCCAWHGFHHKEEMFQIASICPPIIPHRNYHLTEEFFKLVRMLRQSSN